jgi:hypothetical protein
VTGLLVGVVWWEFSAEDEVRLLGSDSVPRKIWTVLLPERSPALMLLVTAGLMTRRQRC